MCQISYFSYFSGIFYKRNANSHILTDGSFLWSFRVFFSSPVTKTITKKLWHIMWQSPVTVTAIIVTTCDNCCYTNVTNIQPRRTIPGTWIRHQICYTNVTNIQPRRTIPGTWIRHQICSRSVADRTFSSYLAQICFRSVAEREFLVLISDQSQICVNPVAEWFNQLMYASQSGSPKSVYKLGKTQPNNITFHHPHYYI